MKRILYLTIFYTMTLSANPLLEPFKTPFETTPFDKIQLSDYEPAFNEAIKQHDKEIEVIVNNSKPATFSNTIEALERSGKLLNRISLIFFALTSANSNEEMMKLEAQFNQLLTEHNNNLMLNEPLFVRIRQVYENVKNGKEGKDFTPEQKELLERTYKNFERSGATLSKEDKKKYKKLDLELNRLTTLFGQNVLKGTYAFELVLSTPEELEGLPQSEREAAQMRAKEKGKEGKYLFDLSYPSYFPFMKYSANRALREKMYRAYNSRCLKEGEFDNREVVKQIVSIRREIANLLGYHTYADYSLQNKMAKSPDKVYALLYRLREAYTPTARKEVEELKAFATELEGRKVEIMPWDWSYYSEKLKNKKFNLNDEMLKPYFELSCVIQGVLGLATDLYGLTFKKNEQIPVYHPEVEAYEVYDKDGKFLSVFYTDFFPREGKQPGAWSTEFKQQWKEGKKDSRPHQSIVMNFTRPTETEPALLTYNEVETFLHEFGHALHGMLTNCTYTSISGYNVYWDFVELPSQIMENWLSQKEFLDKFAKHYKTGEKIPTELVQKIVDAENFNVGYACLRQLSFGYLDMAWHTLTEPFMGDVVKFEHKAMEDVQLLPVVDSLAMGTAFTHIFAGGYAAGYYSYKWAEVLDADAFSVFQKNGIFDKATAQSFRDNILSRGGSEDPAILYKRFRGQEPTIEALLIRNGIKQKK